MSEIPFFQPIGIAGNACVGKDTLCNFLIQKFKKKYKITAKRCSIAGDTIRKDLKSFILDKTGVDIECATPEEKTLLRPIMVEYGRYMRNKTQGRYFIEKIKQNKDFGADFIPIIPDIRYVEFEKDELFWLKKENEGLLIFLERKGIEPANKFELENNKKLKKNADLVFNIPNFKSNIALKNYSDGITDKIITSYFDPITTYR
jgi:hypothetical protein